MTQKLLGPDDEPDRAGAVVAVHYGDYHEQEIWLKAGIMGGTWYPLGGEGHRPQVVEDPRSSAEKLVSREPWRQPPGTIPRYPEWSDVLARGPVTLLTPGQDGVYAAGWAAGRRRLLQQIESLGEDEDVPPGPHGWLASQSG